VLRQPRVLLFDEATSALDTGTESQVIQNLRRLGCTQVTVAHRLSTVQHADVIVVMEKGRVIEVGNHGELLARGGAYATLVAAASMQPAQARPPQATRPPQPGFPPAPVHARGAA
jgi:ATP-binding cassette subfamily B protein